MTNWAAPDWPAAASAACSAASAAASWSYAALASAAVSLASWAAASSAAFFSASVCAVPSIAACWATCTGASGLSTGVGASMAAPSLRIVTGAPNPSCRPWENAVNLVMSTWLIEYRTTNSANSRVSMSA
jgi:hypothetical protein